MHGCKTNDMLAVLQILSIVYWQSSCLCGNRTIEDYVQSINRCEEQINVLYDEVEELRDRLGLDPREPINIDELRHNKMMHINQDRALNRVLNKEVCIHTLQSA